MYNVIDVWAASYPKKKIIERNVSIVSIVASILLHSYRPSFKRYVSGVFDKVYSSDKEE